ncbi:MAG: cyclic nucleotide-binding domain-containing protein [Candidatus Binatia bacterium]
MRTSERLAAILALLSRNSFFQRCRRSELEFLAATSYPLRFQPGDALCREGTYASQCFVLAAGHAVVRIDRRGVGVVTRDDVVGERGVLLGTVRAATVIADAPTLACAIARERLESLVEDNRVLRNWMLDNVRRHYPDLG